jgi:hypothetical protein
MIMKNILSAIATLIGYAVITSPIFAQDTTPWGPAHWTASNWLGFCIQIGLFALAIFGIYKLALGGEGKSENLKSETSGLNSGTQDHAVGASADKMNAL